MRAGELCATALAAELGLGLTRIYELRTDYLRACAIGRADLWQPGSSGGDHQPDWPADALALATRLLSSKPPSSYSAVASELRRRLAFKTDRATVRRWAFAHKLAPDTRFKKPRKPVRRWQVRDFGALWQYDATPHAWFPGDTCKYALLDIIDDATRLNTGARIYHAENLSAHLHFLSRTFLAHGLPLALYVDYHSFFFTHIPDAYTQLGEALRFYGITLRYAPTPQAKGKIERRHHYWQNRLPALFAAESIHFIDPANALLDQLITHSNLTEIHREIRTTPHAALQAALAQKYTAIRPAPACPWWRFIWSLRTTVRVADDGTVPVRNVRLSIDAPPRSRVIRCILHDGDIFYLKSKPSHDALPIILIHSAPF